MASDYIVETEGLTKEFKGFVAVNDVNLKVRRGAIHAWCVLLFRRGIVGEIGRALKKSF